MPCVIFVWDGSDIVVAWRDWMRGIWIDEVET